MPRSWREWWRDASKESFAELIEDEDTRELEALLAEIKGTIARAQSNAQDTRKMRDERRSAEIAVSYMIERRQAVVAELSRRNAAGAAANTDARERVLSSAREHLDAGDTAGAVRLVLDWIEGFGRRGKGKQ